MAIIAILTSNASIFFPRYSGVLPTINPATNTVRKMKIIIPYIPQPTPPKTISPSMRLIIATIPASGVRLLCIAFTAPQLVAVVEVDQITLLTIPNLSSLPSRGDAVFNIGLYKYSE